MHTLYLRVASFYPEVHSLGTVSYKSPSPHPEAASRTEALCPYTSAFPWYVSPPLALIILQGTEECVLTATYPGQSGEVNLSLVRDRSD
jgi:hypothetical protein